MKEDPLQKADAIAVLSGNFHARAMEAAKLYHEGFAEEIWLTHPGALSDRLKQFGVQHPSEADCNYQALRKQGVPAKAIHILESSILNTADELDVIGAVLQGTGSQWVIVVTDKPHTRRVYTLWKEFDAGRGNAIVHGVSPGAYNPSRWWKTPGGTTQVMHEVLGMINASAGCRCRPGCAYCAPWQRTTLRILFKMSNRSKRNSLSIRTNCDLYVPASSYSLKLSSCFG